MERRILNHSSVRRILYQPDVVHGATAIVLAGAFSLAWLTFTPPSVLPKSAPLTSFSAARALDQLRPLVALPHPIGSAAHTQVRDNLLKTLGESGLEVQVQCEEVVITKSGSPFDAGLVHNVIARLPGTDGRHAILIAAHYDSVPTGPGAGDDGAALAAMLETARAVRTLPRLQNDLILLFTDGEEVGGLGAHAFVTRHPLAKKVAVALNFEARGTSGPALMFEASSENGWLVQHLAGCHGKPIANSATYEIYRAMPNETDFTHFREAGIAGMNFAFIDDYFWYHTARDDLTHLHPESVQHHGELMLGLIRRLGDEDLSTPRQQDAVYFNLTGGLFIYYPVRWSWVMADLSGAALSGICGIGLYHHRLRMRGIVLAPASFIGLWILAALVVRLALEVPYLLRPEYYAMRQGHPYQADIYMTGLVCLIAAIACLVGYWESRMLKLREVLVGHGIVLLLITVLCLLLAPGMTFLFQIPLTCTTLALLLLLTSDDDKLLYRHCLVLVVAVVPPVLIMVPMIRGMYVGLTLRMAWAVAPLCAMLFGLLLPLARTLMSIRRRSTPAARLNSPEQFFLRGGMLCLTAFSLLFAIGVTMVSFSEDHPRTNRLSYMVDANTQSALWISSNRTTDEWTSQVLGTSPEIKQLEDHFPTGPGPYLAAPAELHDLATPAVTLISDSIEEGTRTVEIRVSSNRNANLLQLYVSEEASLRRIKLADTDINTAHDGNSEGGMVLNYWAPPREGLIVLFELPAESALTLRLIDVAFNLMEIGLPIQPRPPHMMAAPFGSTLSDCTMVSREYRL